jgi:hypothetical protein
MAEKYYPSQVIFDTPEQRKKVQDWVRLKYGRSFSEYCRYTLLKDMREDIGLKRPSNG